MRRVQMLPYLIQMGVDINAKNKRGKNALFYTLSNYEFSRQLLIHGIDINAKDDDGKTVDEHATGEIKKINLKRLREEFGQ